MVVVVVSWRRCVMLDHEVMKSSMDRRHDEYLLAGAVEIGGRVKWKPAHATPKIINQ